MSRLLQESSEETSDLIEEAIEDEEEERLQDLMNEEEKKVKLPVDLLLGNPALVSPSNKLNAIIY